MATETMLRASASLKLDGGMEGTKQIIYSTSIGALDPANVTADGVSAVSTSLATCLEFPVLETELSRVVKVESSS